MPPPSGQSRLSPDVFEPQAPELAPNLPDEAVELDGEDDVTSGAAGWGESLVGGWGVDLLLLTSAHVVWAAGIL